MMIPDRVLVPLMILAGLSVFTEPEIPFTARLIGIFCTALPMYLANLFVDGAFGGGDIRLLAPQDSVSWENMPDRDESRDFFLEDFSQWSCWHLER